MTEFYHYGRYYHGKHIPDTVSLREACQNALTLTPDYSKFSGFKEIEDKPMTTTIIDENIQVGDTIPEMASDLLSILKETLSSNWNAQQRHCILMSAGRNSRVIMMILRDLQADGMDLGDYEIVTHQHEHVYARDICNELNFPLNRLHIWREETVNQLDHYRFGTLDSQPNACRGPVLYLFEEDYDYSNNVFVGFGMAGAIFLYPYTHHWGNLSMARLNTFEGFAYADSFNQWRWEGRILNPFTDINLFEYACSTPDWLYGLQNYDGLRNEMIQQLGGTTTPLIYGHKYNYTFSNKTKTRIKEFYLGSKYFQKFKIEAKPWDFVGILDSRNNHDMKSLGMALMYEGVNHD